MDLQNFINNVVNNSYNNVKNGLASFNNATPFTGTPLTILQREAQGTKLFTANEYFEQTTPDTKNVKEVKAFSKGVNWDTHQFVTMDAPTGGVEIIAVDKKTRLSTERLKRLFPTFDDADKFIHKMHNSKTKGSPTFGGVANLDKMIEDRKSVV